MNRKTDTAIGPVKKRGRGAGIASYGKVAGIRCAQRDRSQSYCLAACVGDGDRLGIAAGLECLRHKVQRVRREDDGQRRLANTREWHAVR